MTMERKGATTATLNNYKQHRALACRIVKETKKECWQNIC